MIQYNSLVSQRDSNTAEAASLSIDAETTGNHDAEILNRVDSSAETQLPDQPSSPVEVDKLQQSGEGQQNKSTKRKREEESVQELKQPKEAEKPNKEVKEEGGSNNNHTKSKRTPEHNKGPEKKKRKQQKPAFQWIGQPIKVQGGRKYFNGLVSDGVKYSVGDAVALRWPEDELWYLQITSLSKIGTRSNSAFTPIPSAFK